MKSFSIKDLLTKMTIQLQSLENKIDVIDERTKSYPKLYDNVDKLLMEVVENRQERTFIHSRLDNHEQRLGVLEKQF